MARAVPGNAGKRYHQDSRQSMREGTVAVLPTWVDSPGKDCIQDRLVAVSDTAAGPQGSRCWWAAVTACYFLDNLRD